MDTYLYPLLTSYVINNTSSIWCSVLTLMITLYGKNIIQFILSFLPIFQNSNIYTSKACISLRNNIVWNTYFDKTFMSVNHKICSYAKKGGKFDISEYSLTPTFMEMQSDLRTNTITFFNSKGFHKLFGIKLQPNIQIRTSKETEVHDKGFVYTNLIIQIYSLDNKYSTIQEFINTCIQEYDEYTKCSLDRQHIFIFNHVHNETNKIVFSEVPFETTKNFDNMYFEQKDSIVKCLDNFIENESEYTRLGIPYTLGFLFCGPRGVGKTSCIKSIAKYTNRHIVIIPMKNIKSIDVLMRIFLNDEINDKKVSNKKRLYVFEEIDCGTWSNIVTNRNDTNGIEVVDKKKSTNNEQLLNDIVSCIKKCDVDSEIKNANTNNTEKELTLGDFLELLDGVIEIPGRMIIMTSNHPEKLDQAIVRPGRIDKIIKFTNMTKKNVSDMYKLWFHEKIPENVYCRLKNHQFSQAELGNIFQTRDKKLIHSFLSS